MRKVVMVLAITAQVARSPYPNVGGFGVACAAIEGFCRQLAAEVDPQGIRVVCLRSAGSPDAPSVDETFRYDTAQALGKAIPNAHVRTLEGQTHNVDPDVLAPVLMEFFSG